MNTRRLLIGIVALLVLQSGCGEGEFRCSQDSECAGSERSGFCEATEFCSFSDETCASGRRYSDLSGPWSTTCVPGEDESGSTSLETSGAPPVSSSSSQPGSETTMSGADSSTTADADSSTTTGAESSSTETTNGTTGNSGASETGGASTDTGDDPTVVFADDFERPNSTELGNGWFEKTPAVFSIESGRVAIHPGASATTVNAIATHGVDTMGADVHIAADFRLTGPTATQFPQIYARLDESQLDQPDTLVGYLCFITQDSTGLRLRRRDGLTENTLGTVALGETLIPGEDYELSLLVTGQDPVELRCAARRMEGGAVTELAEFVFTDEGTQRITEAGAIGLSAATDVDAQQFTYDNVVVTEP